MLHILIMTAFLGGIIAPACGFAWGGQFSVIEICTAKGMESRVVNNESERPSHKLSEQCQFCFAHANVMSFLPASLKMALVEFVQEKQKFQAYEIIFLSHLNIQSAPRGPPIFV